MTTPRGGRRRCGWWSRRRGSIRTLTLGEALASRPRQVMEQLVSDGVVTPRERPALQDARTGALTPRGKDFVTKAVVGSVLPDAQLMEAAPASVLQKVARAAPQIVRLRNAEPEWDLSGPLQEAVMLQARAQAEGMPLADLLSQGDLYGEQVDPRAAMLALALDETPKQFQRAMERYAGAASGRARGQQLMPGLEAGTPGEALAEAVDAGHALPPGAPTALERARVLPSGAEWDAEGHALLVDDAHWRALSEARQQAGLPGIPLEAAAVALEPRDMVWMGRMAQPALAAAALRMPELGVAVVRHSGTPAEMRRARLEEWAHLIQARMDGGRAAAALSGAEATAYLGRRSGLRLWAAQQYGPDLAATLERARARGWDERVQAAALDLHAMMEVGARLMIGAYDEMDLGEEDGAAARREYLAAVERSNHGGVERGRELAQVVGIGFVRAGGAGVAATGYSAAGGGAAGGPAPAPGLRGAEREPGAGRERAAERAARDLPRAGGAAEAVGPGLSAGPAQLREPERGPLAAVFHVWDKVVQPVAGALGKVDAAFSKYHGATKGGRMALRSYGGRREFAGLQAMRAGEALYTDVQADLHAQKLADTLPQQLKIQHAIEEPAKYPLTPAEERVKRALVSVRDAITVREVGRGWLTPDALRGASLDSLGAADRAKLTAALQQWRRVKAELERPEQAQPLVQTWLQDAIPGTEEPYWPHEYLDMPPEQPGGKRGARNSSMSARPASVVKPRTFRTLSEAEAAGFHPDPDAVAVITRELFKTMTAENASDLLRDLGQLEPEEFLPDAASVHGEPVAEPGYRLAKGESALRGKLKAAEMGGAQPQVSERLAKAVEEVVGPGQERGRAARIAQSAWAMQRALNFWNITKHSTNVAMLALQRGWGEGTRALATARPHAAAGEARIALGPLGFVTDPEVLRQSLRRGGEAGRGGGEGGAVPALVQVRFPRRGDPAGDVPAAHGAGPVRPRGGGRDQPLAGGVRRCAARAGAAGVDTAVH